MMNKKYEYVNQYFSGIKKGLDIIEYSMLSDIYQIVDTLINARNNDKLVITIGNGGSASTASHLASDLNKTAIVEGEKRFKAISLTDNLPLVTAWSNDKSYDDVFSEQLKNFVGKGDIVLGISGSGKSRNIIKAIETANSMGAITIGITGFDGGVLKQVAKHALVVPSNNMQHIEDIHVLISHLITSIIKNGVYKNIG